MIFEDPFSNETLQKVIIRSYSTLHGPYCLFHRYSFSQSDLLGEACRVMSIFPIDFIEITLSCTIAELFSSCDQKSIGTYCERTV